MPPSSIEVAAKWRRSCSRTPSSPSRARRRANRLVMSCGRTGTRPATSAENSNAPLEILLERGSQQLGDLVGGGGADLRAADLRRVGIAGGVAVHQLPPPRQRQRGGQHPVGAADRGGGERPPGHAVPGVDGSRTAESIVAF